MTIQDFLNNTERKLTKYDAFGATERFNELWNTIHIEIVDKYDLPALHLWETGFCKGDASDEEIEDLIAEINSNYNENLKDEDDLCYFLDRQFLLKINPRAESLINEYELAFYCY